MSKRIFCDKCMRMALASPTDKNKNLWLSNCGCKFRYTEIENIEVKTKYYTKKHGDLINSQIQVKSKWFYSRNNDKTLKGLKEFREKNWDKKLPRDKAYKKYINADNNEEVKK